MPLGGGEVLEFLGFLVCEFVELIEEALAFVFADFLFLLEFLDGFFNVAADVAHGGAMILQNLVQVFHQVLAALLGERRDRHT